MYEFDGESLIIADQSAELILHLGNVTSNNINISVLVPHTWASGEQFYYPFDVFVDVKDGYNLYVSDSGNNRILMFYSMQTILLPLKVIDGSANSYDTTVNGLEGPYGIKRDDYGSLYVADLYNQRIMRWTPNATSGVVIVSSDTAGSSSMELCFPSGLFLDTYNSLLYVADTYNHRIQLFNLTGPTPYNGITVAGGNGECNGTHQLNQPCAIWVSKKTGTMYIADSENNRAQHWTKGSAVGVTIVGDPSGMESIDATKLQSSSGLAINADAT